MDNNKKILALDLYKNITSKFDFSNTATIHRKNDTDPNWDCASISKTYKFQKLKMYTILIRVLFLIFN